MRNEWLETTKAKQFKLMQEAEVIYHVKRRIARRAFHIEQLYPSETAVFMEKIKKEFNSK